MRYVSTRGRAPELGFSEALLAGLASDGGLYVPSEWPELPDRSAAPDYAAVAAAVMSPFVPSRTMPVWSKVTLPACARTTIENVPPLGARIV